MTTQTTILLLAAILLIPLIPAVIIYLLLPSKTNVKGPFKGLSLNLTGAFGGYFLLVLVAAGIVTTTTPDPKSFPRYEEYSVLGSIDLEGPEVPNLDSRLVQLYFFPRLHNVSQIGTNHFEWESKIPLKRGFENDIGFPYQRIVVEYPGFITRQIELRSGDIQEGESRITFEPVTMKVRPARRTMPTVELTHDQ